MKTRPISDKKLIPCIGERLKEKSDRDYLLFMMGLYTGPRIEEYLSLRVNDVRDQQGNILDEVNIFEHKKGGKIRRVKLNSKIRNLLKEYTKDKAGYEFLFQSGMKGKNGEAKPISRVRAWQILSEAGSYFGIKLAPHSLRKTSARAMLELANGDVYVVMEYLGHTSIKQTTNYLQVTEEIVDGYVDQLDFG